MYKKKEIMQKTLWFLSCVCFFFAMGGSVSLAKQDQLPLTDIQSYVDAFDIEDNKIVVQGWIGATNDIHKRVSLSAWLGTTQIYEGKGEILERPDVASTTGHSDWLHSGWRITAPLPKNLAPGEYALKVLAKFDNGTLAQLSVNPQIQHITIDEHTYKLARTVRIIKLALFFILIVLVGVYFQAPALSKTIFSLTSWSIKPPLIFGLTLLLSFFALLSMGLTGSSLQIGLQQTPFVQSDILHISGKDQFIRGDEFLVLTPFAMAQYNHTPKYPVVNTNVGEDGQNMLVLGMTGVPVAHISSLAKPATWGFFFFDLQRALSWLWYFPIFACLLALWGVMSILLPGNWRNSFLIALWFSISPYVVAWSHWPAYAVFFPSLAFVSAIAILRLKNCSLILALGCLLGLTLAGFVLLLYPPWQISLAYIFLALFIGVLLRDKLYRDVKGVHFVAFFIATLVTCLILSQWWISAHTAIQAMLATVYPGQRNSVTGGTFSFPEILRGMSNFVTLHKVDGFRNQCEMASFSYLFLPLLVLFGFRCYQKTMSALEVSLAVLLNFILYFMVVGIPVEIAHLSLWGRVPPQRADIALGLSYIILCGLLLSPALKPIPKKKPITFMAFIVALLWAIIAFKSISLIHKKIFSDFSPSVLMCLFSVYVAGGYFLMKGDSRKFIFLNIALSIATTWPFHTINKAPHNIVFTSFVNIASKEEAFLAKKTRILVLDSQCPAMYLLASGFPVANGVFYYPQTSLWERLDKNYKHKNIYNRYHHLNFYGGLTENAETYRIETPHLDQVRVTVDLEKFDFGKTGAGLIVAPRERENALRKNPQLTYITTANGWVWLKTIRNNNPSVSM